MKIFSCSVLLITILLLTQISSAQNVEVDVSACNLMYNVLSAMKGGKQKAEVSEMLDKVLQTKPYQTMFKHYNREWRPNHLPEQVFKKMILSLQYSGEYSIGENERADQMLLHWKNIYNNLRLYKKNLDQLTNINIEQIISDAVNNAKTWLPQGWNIPDSYFFIHPNGGSNGFVINGAQGYDFLQIPRDSSGNIDWNEFAAIISHESHHLGLKKSNSGKMSSSDSAAYFFLTLFIGEGTATKFVDNAPGGYVPVVNLSKANTFTGELETLWKKYTSQEEIIFKRFIETFENLYSGKLTKSAIGAEAENYWFTGLKGPGYFLGAEFFGAIYHGFGKGKVFEAMQDPGKILLFYNEAVKSKPDLLKNCFLIPDHIVEKSLKIGKSDD